MACAASFCAAVVAWVWVSRVKPAEKCPSINLIPTVQMKYDGTNYYYNNKLLDGKEEFDALYTQYFDENSRERIIFSPLKTEAVNAPMPTENIPDKNQPDQDVPQLARIDTYLDGKLYNSTFFTYNSQNQVEAITTTFYNDIGVITQSNSVTYTYDDFGRLTSKCYPGSGMMWEYTYNADGKIVSEAGPQEPFETRYEYDDAGRLLRKTFGFSDDNYFQSETTYSNYNADGLPLTAQEEEYITSESRTISLCYDYDPFVILHDLQNQGIFVYVMDSHRNLILNEYVGSNTAEYKRDQDGRLRKIISADEITEFIYTTDSEEKPAPKPTEPPKSTNNPEAENAYREFIRSGQYMQYVDTSSQEDEYWNMIPETYAIMDLNADGVPELLINTEHWDAWTTNYVFTYNGAVTYMDSIYSWLGFEYHKNINAISYACPRPDYMGGSYDFVQIGDGQLSPLYTLGYEMANWETEEYAYFMIDKNGNHTVLTEDKYVTIWGDSIRPTYYPISDFGPISSDG